MHDPSSVIPTNRVLIADDDTPTRMLLRAAISQWGYDVIEAKDGDEAWQLLLQDDAPRLLILDWLMPKLDGITICSRSRKELSFSPYIILLTQMTGITNLIKGLEAGADEFLSKPFNMAELKSRLSIGARIIRSENLLAAKAQSMAQLMLDLDRLIKPALEITKQLKKSDQTQSLEAVNHLHHQLQQIEELIETIQPEVTEELSNL